MIVTKLKPYVAYAVFNNAVAVSVAVAEASVNCLVSNPEHFCVEQSEFAPIWRENFAFCLWSNYICSKYLLKNTLKQLTKLLNIALKQIDCCILLGLLQNMSL